MPALFFALKGKTLVLIDWANVFHAQRKNGWNVDTRKLFTLFKDHQEVQDIVLFHGTDQHEKSESFLKSQAAIGYRIVTKAVKKVPVTVDHEGKPLAKPILRRKCDFDVEIAKEILLSLDRYQGFILVSGDGDYAPIFDALRERRKQAILVFPRGGLGREYMENEQRKRALFLCSLERLRPFIESKISRKDRSPTGRDWLHYSKRNAVVNDILRNPNHFWSKNQH